MRQIVLDTETTGIEPSQGHRIIEIGCVEMVGRKLTGRTYHQYINPDREVEAEAISVHGITNEYLADKPRFTEIVDEFIEFIRGAELIIHNAPFDVGFINHEFNLAGPRFGTLDQICTVFDTLTFARQKHPGAKNSLDALCKRYGVDNSNRELHGALLDSEILADVYLFLTGGQTDLSLGHGADGKVAVSDIQRVAPGQYDLAVVRASAEELAEHEAMLDRIDKKSGGSVWRAG
ncbi:DNA polymerase III subunit epsilon [Motiliproteus sp. SC1-56]|uniref:DNA polymerase III subunit epsilon n=1 Tax=Motiliproteus sp. SC1-56 TaxID=2799565 RepID=UPI001A90AD7A|nr:DNA polymerase III subunit epsilon [Motiliproteus sp. SC1-56]